MTDRYVFYGGEFRCGIVVGLSVGYLTKLTDQIIYVCLPDDFI
jgi:hypothetical protein